MKNISVGLITLALKLGPKIISILIKMTKALKVGKGGLAAASMASYTYLFTWQFAAIIMLMLVVHESGHIWAMKRYGMKTKGIYFIPFFGGAAVAEDAFPSYKAEVFVAISGPIWGFVLTLATGGLYVFTQNPLFAAAASWMAMVNLFNLLPINPLDGGRVVKSIAFSIHSRVGLVFLIIGIIASVFMAVKIGFVIFYILLIIGFIEFAGEYYKRKKEMDEYDKYHEVLMKPKQTEAMSYNDMALSTLAYTSIIGVLWGLMTLVEHVPGADVAMELLRG